MEVLTHPHSALVTDIDGTIARIVSRPEDAAVSPKAREALTRLADELTMVAVVTGREDAVARRMVGVDALTYVASYALSPEDAQLGWPQLDFAKAKAVDAMASLPPCVTLEEKDISFSLHFRNCDEPDVRERVLAELAPIAAEHGGKLLEGKQVFEMAPSWLPDKGTALARLAAEKGIEALVFVGDDLADVAVFKEITRLREEDGMPGLSVAVIDPETDPLVRQSADVEVEGVSEVEELLTILSLELRKDGGE